MTTLRINWIYPSTNLSGGAKSNRLIAEAMARRGHDVRIYYSSKAKPWPGPLQPRVLWRRVASEWKQRKQPRPHHLMKSSVPVEAVDQRPIRAEDVRDADVVIATWWETREWIESWPAPKGKKAYFIRGYEVFGGDPERVRATYRLPGMKLVIARWLARLMEEEFGDPGAVLVPNGVDRGQFNSTPRELGAPPTVGLLYSHLKLKGVDTAFEAIRIARRSCPELRLVTYGSEDLHDWMNPPEGIEHVARPAQADLAALYRRCDCWVVPSTSEGFAMPGLEAAACRCPVVATRCGGPEDYVEDGRSGFLVPVGDAAQMAARILEVVRQPAEGWRAMSEASYAIAKRFDWDRSAVVLEEALLGLVGARGRGAAVSVGAGG